MLKHKKKERMVEIPSASMADIAFLLLVFFLVTTTIDMEKGLDIALPPAIAEDIKIPKENITNILINETGNVLMGNDAVSVNDIKDIAMEKIRKNQNMIFSLKTTRDTKYEDFIAVFDQLKQAKCKKISLADPDEG
jgi:biopolymer transport protein ExbD